MIYTLGIREEAESDISQCFTYYEEVRVGLGHDFLLCVEEGLAKIQRNPLSYRIAHKNLRRMAIRHFPYRIFYLVQDRVVVVTAVFHAHKNPKSWRKRT
jgi:toxin ParE1/3/4